MSWWRMIGLAAIVGIGFEAMFTPALAQSLQEAGRAELRPPVSFIEFSGVMSDASSGSLFAGNIAGSFYNAHTTKAIKVTEVSVESSQGRRVFKVEYRVGPQAVTRVLIRSGLYLDFRDPQMKGWWNLKITKVAWDDSPE